MKKRKPSTHAPAPTPSRRQFLGASAALGATAACSAPETRANVAPVQRARPRAALADGEPVRIGVIGTGGMGRGHCSSIAGLAAAGREDVEIVAVADVCKTHLDAAQGMCVEKQGGAEVDAYRDYAELLDRGDVHGVVIASPEHWHADMAIDAIRAGKDVYLEKPMTLNLADALRLREVVHANDAMFQVGTQFLQIPKYHKARELIQAGTIGHPTFSQTSYCRNSLNGEWLYGIDERVQPGEMLDWDAWCGPLGAQKWDTEVFHRWRRYRKWSTGIIGDLLVHKMTPLVWAMDVGWPTRVSASGGHYVDKAMENHDQVLLTIEFEREHTMIVAGSTCNETGLEDLVRGHQANIYLGGNSCRLVPERIFNEDIDPAEHKFQGISDQDEHRLDWLASIRTREAPRGDIDTATKVMVIVDLATRSMWEGSSFAFDPETLRARAV